MLKRVSLNFLVQKDQIWTHLNSTYTPTQAQVEVKSSFHINNATGIFGKLKYYINLVSVILSDNNDSLSGTNCICVT